MGDTSEPISLSVQASHSLLVNDEDLFFRLRNFEDHFVERKVYSDQKDWLKTVVAFANSTPVGLPAVLFIGVTDRGLVQSSKDDLDSVQRTLGKVLTKAYPPIYYMTRVLKEGDQQFLAVVVPGSAARPHFAGPSYVRKGSESQEASEEQFQSLVAERSSKVYEIRKWIGSYIQFEYEELEPDPEEPETYRRVRRRSQARLVGCTQHFVELGLRRGSNAEHRCACPLEDVKFNPLPHVNSFLIRVMSDWTPH